MKRKLIMTAIVIVTLAGCKKNPKSPSESTNGTNINTGSSTTSQMAARSDNSYKDVQLKGDMLEFTTFDAFRTIIQDVEKRNNEVHGEGETDFKGSVEFENAFNFNSLRKKVETLRAEWLHHEELDFNNDPSDKYIGYDPLRTVLNENSAVKVDGRILIIKPYETIVINDGSVESYYSILNNNIKGLEHVEIQKADGSITDAKTGNITTQGGSCYIFGLDVQGSQFAGNRYLKSTLFFWNGLLWGNTLVAAGSEHFKKITINIWPFPTQTFWIRANADYLDAGYSGFIYDIGCSQEESVSNGNSGHNIKTISAGHWYIGTTKKYIPHNVPGNTTALQGFGSAVANSGATSVALQL